MLMCRVSIGSVRQMFLSMMGHGQNGEHNPTHPSPLRKTQCFKTSKIRSLGAGMESMIFVSFGGQDYASESLCT